MEKKEPNWWGSPKTRILAVRERYKKAEEADRENRQAFVDDMKFIHEPGAQWDDYTKRQRTGPDGKEVRPMMQFNRARTTIKRIVNNMRANPAAGKVRGSEDGDKDTADVLEGLIRNIANQSDFDAIRDNAAEYQVAAGYAAWRITTNYADDTAFEQDIKIEGLRNPLCLFCDPHAYDITGRDATYWILTDKISKEAYKTRYPKAEPCDFEDTQFDDGDAWEEDDKVRIAEHWWKQPVTKTIHLLSDGQSIDESELKEAQARGLQSIKSRTVQTHDLYSAIYSGDAELTPPQKWAGKHFPWVRIYGEYVCIEGKVTWFGLTRHIKDAQRAFNLSQTATVETIASSPINQVWATAKQAEGMAQHWADAVNKNLPFQVYNNDPNSPGPPVRVGGAPVPVALMQNSQIMGEEIKANSGIFDASLGAQSNETSGRAISARQQQGEIATFNYPANMGMGVKRTWEILVDLVPRIIDTPRSMRILGADDSEKYVKVNQPGPNGEVINDLSRGKYDVVITVGPSFSTKRQEAVEAYSQMAQGNPELMQVAGDLIMKGMDLPYADEVAERIKMMLPPPIQQAINKDKPMPPEVQQAMMQVDQAMQQVQQQGQMVQAAAQEAQQEKAEAEKAKSEVQLAIANLKTEEAKFQTMVAKAQAEMAQKAADMQATGESAELETEKQQLSAQLAEALAIIQQQAADFMQQSIAVMAQIQEAQKPVIVTEAPKARIVAISKENGTYRPIYEDQLNANG
jgi:hypothetical protein